MKIGIAVSLLVICSLTIIGCSGTESSTATEIATEEVLPQNTVPPQPTDTVALPTATIVAPSEPTQSPTDPVTCEATQPDMLGPFFTPGAPERTSVGSGYILSGVVRSQAGCGPIPGAVIEVWMAGPDGEYTDDYRATIIANTDGSYRFESHVPVPYGGRPPHIHLRVTDPGFNELVTQHYPTAGQVEAVFDLVLIPTQ